MNIYAELGFTVTEEKIYTFLSTQEEADAKTIIRELGLHKKVVYDNLVRLEQKSLISQTKIDRRAVYRLNDPRMLAALLKTQEEKLAHARIATQEHVKELQMRKRQSSESQEIQLYQGINGIKQYYASW